VVTRASFHVLLMAVYVVLVACGQPESESANGPAVAAPPGAAVQLPVTPAINAEPVTHYFFDVYGHSADEITALLMRAKATHDNLPESLQGAVNIAMVLHGPDVAFFASDRYDEYRELVDLARDLDTLGYVDLKICAASVRNRGLDAQRFPSFIEFVPYGPAEVNRLKSEGYVRL